MGRPIVWGPDRLEEIFAEVDAIKSASGGTDRQALERLVRKIKWGPPANHRGGRDKWLETLESRLQQAKRLRRRAAELEVNFAKLQRIVIAKDKTPNSGNPSDGC